MCTKYKIPQFAIIIFSCCSLLENLTYLNYMAGIGKRNDFIIQSLHDYYKQNKKKVYLFLTEYGPDVTKLKNLLKN